MSEMLAAQGGMPPQVSPGRQIADRRTYPFGAIQPGDYFGETYVAANESLALPDLRTAKDTLIPVGPEGQLQALQNMPVLIQAYSVAPLHTAECETVLCKETLIEGMQESDIVHTEPLLMTHGSRIPSTLAREGLRNNPYFANRYQTVDGTVNSRPLTHAEAMDQEDRTAEASIVFVALSRILPQAPKETAGGVTLVEPEPTNEIFSVAAPEGGHTGLLPLIATEDGGLQPVLLDSEIIESVHVGQPDPRIVGWLSISPEGSRLHGRNVFTPDEPSLMPAIAVRHRHVGDGRNMQQPAPPDREFVRQITESFAVAVGRLAAPEDSALPSGQPESRQEATSNNADTPTDSEGESTSLALGDRLPPLAFPAQSQTRSILDRLQRGRGKG